MRHMLLFALALVLGPAFGYPQSAEKHSSVLRDHQGFWMGELKLPKGRTVKSGVELFTRADGSEWASYASPDRDAYDIPVLRIHDAGNTMELDLGFASLTLRWLDDRIACE